MHRLDQHHKHNVRIYTLLIFTCAKQTSQTNVQYMYQPFPIKYRCTDVPLADVSCVCLIGASIASSCKYRNPANIAPLHKAVTLSTSSKLACDKQHDAVLT